MPSASMGSNTCDVLDSRSKVGIQNSPKAALQRFTGMFLNSRLAESVIEQAIEKHTSVVGFAVFKCVPYGSLAVMIPSPSLSHSSCWSSFCLIWSATKFPSVTKLRIVWLL